MKRGLLRIKKLTVGFVKIVFLVLLLVCIYLMTSSKLFGIPPQLFGFQLVTVLSGSMEPTIKSGSLILVKGINDPSNLQLDDIITFQSPRHPGELITHRIVEIVSTTDEIYFSTKGDANSTADGRKISSEELYGSYQNLNIPYAGYFLQYTKTKIGFIVFFLIPLLLLLFSSTRDFIPSITRRNVNKGAEKTET